MFVSNSTGPADGPTSLCAHFAGIASYVTNIKCDQFVSGRYVIVGLSGSQKLLTLCEVQVYGKVTGMSLIFYLEGKCCRLTSVPSTSLAPCVYMFHILHHLNLDKVLFKSWL